MSKNFVANKLKIQGKQTLSTIALILILTLSTFMASLPAANAHTPAWSIPTYAYVSLSPNPVGVGQTLLIAFWLNIVPPTANGGYGDRWQNLTVTITSSSGTTTTLGPFTSDPAGSSYTYWVPPAVGNYTVQAHYAGQTLAGANPPPVPNSYSTSPNIGDYYQPSTSTAETLVVQQQAIPGWVPTPLPTDFWSRPIDAQNREWNAISGNWLGTGIGSRGSNWYNATTNFNPYTTCPESGHVVWTKPLAFGGVIGGEYGSSGTSDYYMGSSYEPFLRPPVIIQGTLYYNTPNPPRYGFCAVDLRTGEQKWYNNGTNALPTTYAGGSAWPQITCGQILNYISPNQYGGTPYLWYLGSPNYYMYDAFTGNYILTLTNASTGTVVMDPNGNMLVYIMNSATNQLVMWNSTQAIAAAFASTPSYAAQGNGYWLWRPPTGTFDWRAGIQWNVSIPNVPGQTIKEIAPPVIWARSVTSTGPTPTVVDIGYSSDTGALLWGPTNRTGDEAWETTPGTFSATIGGWAVGDGVFCVLRQETMQWFGYDLNTGTKLWGPSAPASTNAWGVYSTAAYIAYGMLFEEAADGVHAFNVKTGAKVWDFADLPSGTETAYGLWPTESANMLIADGKVLVPVAHSHLQPLFRGAALYCVDAYTGKELWNVTGWYADAVVGQVVVIADGYIVAFNGYDNEIFCFGKGLTATTVTAPNTAVPKGTSVLIQGTVTDQSPGQTCLGIPAKGTPAISDDSMSPWMAYLYMSQPEPTDARGVPVTLTAIDPNGNTQNIGTVTSNILGNYAIAWTPPVPGLYTITATFAGSKSYFSSQAGTALVVSNAPAAQVPNASPTPAATPPPTATPTASGSPQVTTTPAPAPGKPGVPMTYIIIAVAAVIVVVAAAALALRRRK